jgi:hypothetical protein
MHNLAASAADAAGNVSVPSKVVSASIASTTTADTTPPAAPTIAVDGITTSHQVVVGGTAEANSTVKVYDANTLVGTAKTDASGSWTVTTSVLSTGTHNLAASAADAAGNVSVPSKVVSPTIDSVLSASVAAPTPIGSHSGTGASTLDITNVVQSSDHTATIKGTADPSSQIKLFDGTTSVGSVTTGADGKWSFQTSDLSGTTHAFTAQQVDAAGHVVGTSSGQAIVGSGVGNTLTGTPGNDVMVGKGGADTFVFASNFGHDVIMDFAASGPAHDTIQFSKTVFDSFASVLSHATQSGQDVVIAAGNDTLTLKNTKLDSLNSHDFHFA